MNRRRNLLITLGTAVVLTLVAMFVWRSEPCYGGRSLTDWAIQAQDYEKLALTDRPGYLAASNAIHQMGPAAAKTAVDWLESDAKWVVNPMSRWLRDFHLSLQESRGMHLGKAIPMVLRLSGEEGWSSVTERLWRIRSNPSMPFRRDYFDDLLLTNGCDTNRLADAIGANFLWDSTAPQTPLFIVVNRANKLVGLGPAGRRYLEAGLPIKIKPSETPSGIFYNSRDPLSLDARPTSSATLRHPLSPMRTFSPALLTLALTTLAASAADYFPPPDSTGGWRTTKNAAETRQLAGMDAAALERAYDFTQRCTQNGGLVVVRKGYLVFERYFGRAGRNVNPDMASTGKAYTSIACGIMLQEFHDKIPDGLNSKVFTEKFLPEALPLDDPRRADITLGHLLCMSAGYWGEGGAPTAVADGKVLQFKSVPGQNIRDLDQSSLKVPMWTNAGGGYSYSSPAPHIASIVLRHVTGMELDRYIDERLAKPMGWGPWGYCLNRGGFRMPHANGAGSIAVHATDAVRFGYCLAHGGQWAGKQLVPADYLALCAKPSPFNPHTPFSLQFEHNSDAHVAGAPKDAFWKSGAGGFGLLVVPSLDLVIYKMGGNNGQYDPTLTDVPQPKDVDTSRDNWKPIARTPFNEGSLGGDDGLRRVLEMVSGAVRD